MAEDNKEIVKKTEDIESLDNDNEIDAELEEVLDSVPPEHRKV